MSASKGTIYAIHGLQRSGKGTIADAITVAHPDAILVKFADVIKEMTVVLLNEAGYHDEKFHFQCIESSRKEQPLTGFDGLTPRTVLQYAGSEFREFNPDLWTGITEHRMRNLVESGEHKTIIIDDLRFPAEVEMVERIKADYPEWDVKTIKVKRPGFKPQKSIRNDEPKGVTKIFNSGIVSDEATKAAIDCLLKNINQYVTKEEDKDKLLVGKSRNDLEDIFKTTFKGAKKRQKAMKSNKEVHSSENGLDSGSFDILLSNNRSPKELKALVKQYVL